MWEWYDEQEKLRALAEAKPKKDFVYDEDDSEEEDSEEEDSEEEEEEDDSEEEEEEAEEEDMIQQVIGIAICPVGKNSRFEKCIKDCNSVDCVGADLFSDRKCGGSWYRCVEGKGVHGCCHNHLLDCGTWLGKMDRRTSDDTLDTMWKFCSSNYDASRYYADRSKGEMLTFVNWKKKIEPLLMSFNSGSSNSDGSRTNLRLSRTRNSGESRTMHSKHRARKRGVERGKQGRHRTRTEKKDESKGVLDGFYGLLW